MLNCTLYNIANMFLSSVPRFIWILINFLMYQNVYPYIFLCIIVYSCVFFFLHGRYLITFMLTNHQTQMQKNCLRLLISFICINISQIQHTRMAILLIWLSHTNIPLFRNALLLKWTQTIAMCWFIWTLRNQSHLTSL